MTTTATAVTLIDDRFVVVQHERFAYVSDTHATDANGTARVKNEAEAHRWIQAHQDSEIRWDGYLQRRGVTADGGYEIIWLNYGEYRIFDNRQTDARKREERAVHADSPEACQLYLLQRALWWHRSLPSRGARYAFWTGETYRAEIITKRIAWMDNSDEIVGHLGGREQLTAPHGDVCF